MLYEVITTHTIAYATCNPLDDVPSHLSPIDFEEGNYILNQITHCVLDTGPRIGKNLTNGLPCSRRISTGLDVILVSIYETFLIDKVKF